jgi:membrane-anchored protein YejM (alkaline phosphatase superfamily)
VFGCRNPFEEYSTGRLLRDDSPRDFLLIASYERFAVVQTDRITEYFFAGLVQSFDGAPPDPPLPGPFPLL